MKHAYLEVTHGKGRSVAAYYYLPRQSGDTSVRTERVDGGLLVDYSSDGKSIGIEISSPSHIDLRGLNQVLNGWAKNRSDARTWGPLLPHDMRASNKPMQRTTFGRR